MTPRPAGVVLAAGAGTRLRPLTFLRPKALCPVDGVPLVDLALARIRGVAGEGPDRLAVNAHHHADALAAHLDGRVTVSREEPAALGTAGALGALRDWLDGRDALVTNADAYLPGGIGRFAGSWDGSADSGDGFAGSGDGFAGSGDGFAGSWDGRRSRLLCVPVADDPAVRVDFRAADGTGLRYVGVCLLPWTSLSRLQATPSGLFEALWRAELERGELDLVTTRQVGARRTFVDCGTPWRYLRANLHASGGRNVIGAGARVLGTICRCVIWDGARVGPDEHLEDAIRAGTQDAPLTVVAAPPVARPLRPHLRP